MSAVQWPQSTDIPCKLKVLLYPVGNCCLKSFKEMGNIIMLLSFCRWIKYEHFTWLTNRFKYCSLHRFYLNFSCTFYLVNNAENASKLLALLHLQGIQRFNVLYLPRTLLFQCWRCIHITHTPHGTTASEGVRVPVKEIACECEWDACTLLSICS